ncbi:MAG: hypothetical protein J6T87_02420 [Bacteroidales bacterium]|nr:hypothetical protein [Bacteroidales bacterium]
MKKIMVICAATLMLAGLATSCNKKCECKTYIMGVASNPTELELDKDSYKKCSDMNTYVMIDGKKNGLECTSK